MKQSDLGASFLVKLLPVHTHKQLLTKVHEKALLDFKGSQAKKDWGLVI